jgi:hypothetical protein
VSSEPFTVPASPARTARGLGIEIFGGTAVVLLPPGSRAPCAGSRVFTTVSDSQRAVEIRVVPCSAGRVIGAPLARFLLAGIRRGQRGQARIEIGLSLGKDGLLRAWAAESGGSAREETVFSGLPEVFPGGLRGSTLSLVLERARGNWPPARPEDTLRGMVALKALSADAMRGSDALPPPWREEERHVR